MIIEEEVVEPNGIGNIFNKIITENFPILEKEMSIQVQEASRAPNRHEQIRTSPQHTLVKTIRNLEAQKIENSQGNTVQNEQH
jgi:hypothetical protein